MHKAKVTSKGQITLPSAIREQLCIEPGESVVFLPGENGEFRIKRVGSILDLEGCVPYSGPPVTIEQMDEAVAKSVAEDDEATKPPRRATQRVEAA
jgi:AbrB family looped-hinge helix DNA binding protein